MKTLVAMMLTVSASALAGEYPTQPPEDSCDKECSAPRSACPNANEMAVTCGAAGLDVTLCLSRESHEHAHMIINGTILNAKRTGNYAAYAAFEAKSENMIYELGLVRRNGPEASGYFSMTSEAQPFLSEAVDVSCVLPF